MSRTPEQAVTQLTYSSAPTVEGIRVDRGPDRTLIEISVLRGRSTRLLGLIVVFALLAAAFVYVWFTADSQTQPARVGVGIFGALAFGGGGITLVGRRLRELLRPVTIDIDSNRVVYSRRVSDHIGREEWPRTWITGLRILRAGWNESLQREDRVELWFANGQSAILYTGPSAQATAVLDAMSDALGYPRSAAKPSAPITPSRRLTLTVFPGAVEFSLRRPILSWVNVGVMVPAIGIAILVEHFALAPSRHAGRGALVEGGWWPTGRMVAFAVIAWSLCAGMLQKLSRRKGIALINGQLILAERSLISPIREQWSYDQIVHFEVHDQMAGKGRLSIKLVDGRNVDLITHERLADVQWMRDQLAAMFAAQPTGTITAPTDTPESPPPAPAPSIPVHYDRSPDI